MILIKEGVRFDDLTPQLVFALFIASEVIQGTVKSDTWITAISNGEHRGGSDHYIGRAADLRTRDWPYGHSTDTRKFAVAAQIQSILGDQFFVQFEPTTATRTEHIHVAYRPTPIPAGARRV